jgi:opacity protein-like surface antigen
MSQRALRRITSLVPFFGVLLATAPAFAQNPNCPPGGWFCADAQVGGGASGGTPAGTGASGGAKLDQLPPSGDASASGNGSSNAGNNVVIVQQPAAQPAAQAHVPQAAAAPPPPAPVVVVIPPPSYPRVKEWGLNLHLQGAMFGRRDSADNAGMGGIGLALRHRVTLPVMLEGSLDFYGGRDYNGDKRSETAMSLNALLFLMPRSRFGLYLLGGLGFASARIDRSDNYAANASYVSYDDRYSYFGGQAGLGLEWRLGKNVALNTDLRGFIRGRLGAEGTRPEFVSPDGRATNTSGGGLFNVGMSIYF